MIVQSTRFGLFEIDDEQLLGMPEGLPGFPDLRRVAVVNAALTDPLVGLPGADEFFWLQDVDDADVAFLVVSPWAVFSDYEFDADVKLPGDPDPAELVVMVILTIHPAPDAQVRATANLRAPLVVDPNRRVARQVILSDDRWSVRTPLWASEGVAL